MPKDTHPVTHKGYSPTHHPAMDRKKLSPPNRTCFVTKALRAPRGGGWMSRPAPGTPRRGGGGGWGGGGLLFLLPILRQ